MSTVNREVYQSMREHHNLHKEIEKEIDEHHFTAMDEKEFHYDEDAEYQRN